MRLQAAIAAGKLSSLASRVLGRGGGTALPGLVAERLAPDIVARLAGQLGQGSALVSGTNGKTTTALMLSAMVTAAGLRPLHNRSGSNLMRGLAATFVAEAGVGGRLPGAEKRLGVLELDEAALPAAAKATNPRVIALLNLFRDQLDRYGEVDIIADRWREMIKGLPATTTLVLNADDPSVAGLGEGATGPVIYFGVDVPALGGEREHAADIRWCPRCGGEFEYSTVYYGHIGIWRCPTCGNSRPRPQVVVNGAEQEGFAGTSLVIDTPGGVVTAKTRLAGVYNIHNAAAAVAAGVALGLPIEALAAGLAGTGAAFGRQERFELEGKRVTILLGKNPAGFNQLLRTLAAIPGTKHLALFLNDGIADGRDVSWIWDVDFERLKGQVASTVVSGRRAADLALRLRYGGVSEEMTIEEDLEAALDRALANTAQGEDLYILPTYTAMLRVRELVARRAKMPSYWEAER
ncbi:MAG: MurT ligase domain-containing protein [Dehalococcoidia bacterium]